MTAPRDHVNYGWPAAMRDGTACRYLDVSRSTFWRWVDADRLSKGRMVNGVRLWSRQELDGFLARLFDHAGGDTFDDRKRRFQANKDRKEAARGRHNPGVPL